MKPRHYIAIAILWPVMLVWSQVILLTYYLRKRSITLHLKLGKPTMGRLFHRVFGLSVNWPQ